MNNLRQVIKHSQELDPMNFIDTEQYDDLIEFSERMRLGDIFMEFQKIESDETFSD